MTKEQQRPPLWVFLAVLLVACVIITVGLTNPLLPQIIRPPNPFSVAIVLTEEGLNDRGINDACIQGALDALDDFGVEFTQAVPSSYSDIEVLLRRYAEHVGWATPYELIIAVGVDGSGSVRSIAPDYPNQKFAAIDDYINSGVLPNLRSIRFAEEEGAALVGALAGLYTVTNKVGFIGESVILPRVYRYGAGFFWGADLTNPSIALEIDVPSPNIDFGFVSPYEDEVLAEVEADEQYFGGCDIIFSVDGVISKTQLSAVINSARRNNATRGPIWVIGSDNPQMHLGTANSTQPIAPTLVLSSMLKRFDVAIYDTIVNYVVNGQSISGISRFNLLNNGVGWELNNTLLGPHWAVSVTDQLIISDIALGIINGTYIVPTDYPWLSL